MLQSLDDRTAAASEYLQLVRPGIKVHTAELHDAKVNRNLLSPLASHTTSPQQASVQPAVEISTAVK
jgi:hypothetical protein